MGLSITTEEGGVSEEMELLGLGRQKGLHREAGPELGAPRDGVHPQQKGGRVSSEAGSGASMCWGRLQARGKTTK